MLPLTIVLAVLLFLTVVLLARPSARVRRESAMDPRTRARVLLGEDDDEGPSVP